MVSQEIEYLMSGKLECFSKDRPTFLLDAFFLVSCLRTEKAEVSQALGKVLDYDTGPFSPPFFLPVSTALSESRVEVSAYLKHHVLLS